MRWARDVIAPLLVASAPPALSFSGGQHHLSTSPTGAGDSWRHHSSSQSHRSSFSSSAKTATGRRCPLSQRIQRNDHDLEPSAQAITSGGGVGGRGEGVDEGTTAPTALLFNSTRYTIDMDVHPDVASVAVKHACQLPRFLEHYPISTHTEEAYANATKFVRDFHLSRSRTGGLDGELAAGLGEEREAEKGEAGGGYWKDAPQGRFPVVLDSGCGTGRSSALLAQSYPHLPVLGVDRSAVRLSKRVRGPRRREEGGNGERRGGSRDKGTGRSADKGELSGVFEERDAGGLQSARRPRGGGGSGGDRGGRPPANLLLLRADLVDLWILASRDNAWEVKEHSILYPNPYPKRSHLRARWHGHPVFPLLLGLGGRITLRSNWKAYLDEVCQAVLAISGEGENDSEQGSRIALAEPVRRDWRRGGGVNKGGGDTSGLGKPATAAAEAAAAVYVSGCEEARRKVAATAERGCSEAETADSTREGVGGSNAADGRNQQFPNARKALEVVPAAIAAAATSYRASARAGPSRFVPVVPATNFEAKYVAVGEAVYELRLEPRQPTQ